MKFIDLKLIEPIYKAVTKEGYTSPTPIQEQAIPNLLEGKDLIGIAQTGTGKTAAFVLPLLQKLTKNNKPRKKNYPKALILAPTRELAAQIEESCISYGQLTDINSTVVYGGVNQGPQVKALSKGVDILVATPGRLIDLIQQGYIKLDNVETFILDEADRMLDMGFVNDIKRLLPLLSKERQTVMFSATMSKEITKLAKDFLTNQVSIDVSPKDSTTLKRIKQELYYVERTKKLALLIHLMTNSTDIDQVLIFTRTKAGADKIARKLSKQRIPIEALHGNKTQAQRTRILKRFQTGDIVLVATDIAARGIDVEGITHVINYDLPNDPENYVHRIGRTGRAGAEGSAYSFCDETENYYLKAIEKITGEKIPYVEHIFHSEMARKSTQKPPKKGSFRTKKNSGGRSPFRKPSRNKFGRDGAPSSRGNTSRNKWDRVSSSRNSSFGRMDNKISSFSKNKWDKGNSFSSSERSIHNKFGRDNNFTKKDKASSKNKSSFGREKRNFGNKESSPRKRSFSSQKKGFDKRR